MGSWGASSPNSGKRWQEAILSGPHETLYHEISWNNVKSPCSSLFNIVQSCIIMSNPFPPLTSSHYGVPWRSLSRAECVNPVEPFTLTYPHILSPSLGKLGSVCGCHGSRKFNNGPWKRDCRHLQANWHQIAIFPKQSHKTAWSKLVHTSSCFLDLKFSERNLPI